MGPNYDKASRVLIGHHVQNGFDMVWATQPGDMSEDELEGSTPWRRIFNDSRLLGFFA